MTITYDIQIDNDTVYVKASGVDESLSEVEAYGMAIVNAAIESQSTRVLCDERELAYALGTVDTYDYAEYIAARVPRLVKIAIVSSPECADDAAFWEDVVVNRGMTARFFHDREKAEQWLAE
jgi:hypothetical protein